HQVEMPTHHPHAFFKRRLTQQRSRRDEMIRMLKNPRIVKRAATDAHSRATRFVEHPFRSLWRDNIAIADDRNRLHCFHYFADSCEIHLVSVTLFTHATLNKKRRYSRVHQRAP